MSNILLFPKSAMQKKIFITFCILVFLGVTLFQNKVNPGKAEPQASRPTILLGVFQDGWIDQDLVDSQLAPLDAWTGKHMTLVGMNADLEDPVTYLGDQLDTLWNNGYTPFINLSFGFFSKPTAYDIATGNKDLVINQWAQAFASWASGGKFAFISVLPEMNTPYVSYGRDPENYKLAYAHIRKIFNQNNVPSSAVKWVFSPNGWVEFPFEPYYPGDNLVDVIGYSALNQGFCPGYTYWTTPNETVGFSLKEMHRMAPDKPIFVTSLGTTALTATNHSDTASKDQWLRDTYSLLANDVDVRAVIYYNYPKSIAPCDWAIYRSGSNPIQYVGYKDAVQNSSFGYLSPAQLRGTDLTPVRGTNQVYLPQIIAPQSPVMLGAYTQGWPGSQQVIDKEYHTVDAWSGKRLSIAGTFVDMFSDPMYNIEMQFETMWDNGYTPFVNLTVQYNSGITARQIANGYADTVLHKIAKTYATMVQFNHEMAYIAPLQEMNGDWVPYGGDPANYILAYKRIRKIFSDEGVPPESVKWVFAPNGWNESGKPPFESYYPGDAYVDVLAFSAYNFGYCSYNKSADWQSPSEVYDPFIHRFMVLSPNKPIFIAQTATTAYTKQGKSTAAKNQWLVSAYAYFLDHPVVRAVLYYNRWDAECDWSFYQLGGQQYSGYQQGVANPAYNYVSPFILKNLTHP